MVITPQSGGSLYRQLAASLRQQITTGALHPGQMVPSERTLMQQHGLSRETVRNAVALLRAEGLVTIQRGRGVYVREQPEMQQVTPPAGATVTTRMPTDAEQAELDIPEGVPVFSVVNVDGSVVAYPGDRWQLTCR